MNLDMAKPPSNFQGVKEDAAKLITEANERFLTESKKQTTSQQMEDHKWKKTVTSNWDRYIIGFLTITFILELKKNNCYVGNLPVSRTKQYR